MPRAAPASSKAQPSFSVARDNPFAIFRTLRAIAIASRGEADVIDLSRGDPGFRFSPGTQGRKLLSALLWIDAHLNRGASERVMERSVDLLLSCERILRSDFSACAAEELIALLTDFCDGIRESARGEGRELSLEEILRQILQRCSTAGGSYLDPRGEEITRIIVASLHRQETGIPFTSEDVVLTHGASHAIATLFKLLGPDPSRNVRQEAVLRPGDIIAMATPVYYPYASLAEEWGLTVLPLPLEPLTGALREQAWEALGKRHPLPKVVILIDPHNPTGLSIASSSLERLAALVRGKDVVVITDDVYASFVDRYSGGITALLPDQTIRISARSKIERSTGLRFGEIATTPECRAFLARLLGLTDGDQVTKRIVDVKAPGRDRGQFAHTTFVPGPSQLLGIAHAILGREEREEFVALLRENQQVFQEALGIQPRPSTYYVLFDLDELPGCQTQRLPIEERLTLLAEAGVVYLPCYKFFPQATSPSDRGRAGNEQRATNLSLVRASLANALPEEVKRAAKITREVLC